MNQKSQDLIPNARRILNEIMILMFTPKASKGEYISSDQINALIFTFINAKRSEILIVKNLLRKLLDNIEKLENQIELREIEEENQAFEVALKEQEERLNAIKPMQAERLRNEARENLRKWYVTDDLIISQKIKSKELLTLTEFMKIRGISKRAVKSAVAWGRIFSITGAGGQEYYPKFFADSSDNVRQDIGKVCQLLGGIPAYAKYHFLTTDSHFLTNSTTPIQAIKSGRVADVLQVVKWLLGQ